jgi:hypothetical protein
LPKLSANAAELLKGTYASHQMLDTAFHKIYFSMLPKARLKGLRKSENKIWSYVGRFIFGFAMVEYQINQLFYELITVDYAARILLRYTLDLRKKMDLIEIILKSRDIDERTTFKRLHALHDLRNVIVHWPFSESEGGLSCDFMNKQGDVEFPKPGVKEKTNLIKFAELDSYDADMCELNTKLESLLESAQPITDVNDELRTAIEEAISSSNNVVRFPSKP